MSFDCGDRWRDPLLTQRRGIGGGGRVGRLDGYIVNRNHYASREEAAQALSGPAYGTLEAVEDACRRSKRGDGAEEWRADTGEVQVVIDGERWCQDSAGHWRPCSELELEGVG